MNNVILIGMSLCGKSTLGRILSKELCWKFIDTDAVIAEESKESIAGLFEKKGEDYFRLLEKELIDRLLSRKEEKMVIAAGGGMPVYFDNLAKLKKLGKVIFLDTNIQTIISRSSKAEERPLLKDNTILSIIDLYYTRYNIYKKADFHIASEEKEIKKQMEIIVNLLQPRKL